MPFDIGATVNNLADRLLSTPLIGAVAKNPVYTALFITVVILIVIVTVFRNYDEGDEHLSTLTLRSGFWIFLFLTGALFVHNKLLLKDGYSIAQNRAIDDVFGSAEQETNYGEGGHGSNEQYPSTERYGSNEQYPTKSMPADKFTLSDAIFSV